MRPELAAKLRASQERMRELLDGQAALSAAAIETLRAQGEELRENNVAQAIAWADAVTKDQAQAPPKKG